jgi:hypothetical protein
MKYAALGEHLRGLANGKAEVTLRFGEIEEMIAATLPKSARTYREWWANQEGGSRAPHWRAAGFEVDAVDLGRGLVRFRRVGGITAVATMEKRQRTTTQRNAPHRDVLLKAGFRKVGRWTLDRDAIVLGVDVPKDNATYAVVVNEHVQYVGSATGGLKKRVYFYGRPGKTQRTSLRVNGLIKERLLAGDDVELIAAFPEPMAWNGLPVDVVTGLEQGLIKKYCPPWNKRGALGEPLERSSD